MDRLSHYNFRDDKGRALEANVEWIDLINEYKQLKKIAKPMKIKRSLKLDEGAYKAIEYMFTKGVDKELIDKAVNDSGLKDYKDMLIAKDFLKKGMLLSICYLED